MAESSTQAQKPAEAAPKAGPAKKNRLKGKAPSTAAAGPSVPSPPPTTKPAAASGPPTGPKATTTTAAAAAAAAAPGCSKKARQRRKKAANPQANLKLKVVVRRLPPNLPEAIFWKSVEPWTGPQELASSTVPAVASPSSSAGPKQQAGPSNQSSGAAVPEAKATEAAEGDPAQKAADTNVAAESSTSISEPSTAPAGLSEAVEKSATPSPPPKKPGPYLDLGQLGQGKLSWRRYVTGKLKVPNASSISTSSGSPPLHTHSRAYLRFETLDDLIDFHKNFDGHVFRDAKGNESIALVEWAPFQKVAPPVLDVKKRDRKEGTIEEDGDYLDFVQKLNAKTSGGEDKMEGGKTATTTEGDLLAHLSGLQAAKNDPNAIEARKHTPLLDHLRQQKANKKTSGKHKASSKSGGGKLRNPWNALSNGSSTEGSSTAGGSSSTPTGPGSIKSSKKAAARAAAAAATGSPLKKEKGTPKRSLGTTAESGRDSPIPTPTTNGTPASKANKGKEKAKKKPIPTPATAGEASSATGDDGAIAAGNTSMQGVPKGPKLKKKKAPPSAKFDGSVTIEKSNDIAPAAILQRPSGVTEGNIRVTPPPPPTVAQQQPSIPTGPRAASGGARGGNRGGRGRGGGPSGARGGRGAAAAGGNGTAGPAGS